LTSFPRRMRVTQSFPTIAPTSSAGSFKANTTSSQPSSVRVNSTLGSSASYTVGQTQTTKMAVPQNISALSGHTGMTPSGSVTCKTPAYGVRPAAKDELSSTRLMTPAGCQASPAEARVISLEQLESWLEQKHEAMFAEVERFFNSTLDMFSSSCEERFQAIEARLQVQISQGAAASFASGASANGSSKGFAAMRAVTDDLLAKQLSMRLEMAQEIAKEAHKESLERATLAQEVGQRFQALESECQKQGALAEAMTHNFTALVDKVLTDHPLKNNVQLLEDGLQETSQEFRSAVAEVLDMIRRLEESNKAASSLAARRSNVEASPAEGAGLGDYVGGWFS